MKARVKATGEIISLDEKSTVLDTNPCNFNSYEISELEILYENTNFPKDYWEKLLHQYAGMAMQGMATADRKWYDIEKRLPIPTDGDDFLVKIENCEEHYAYAWYAYDRQCFMCYATGLSLPSVTNWMPIVSPIEEDEE